MRPGDVVVGAFRGADTTKVRPAVVLSTELYHRHRPDIIVGLITTQRPKELAPTDCELRDWQQAGVWDALHRKLLVKLNAAGAIDWSRAVVDGSHVRALLGGS